MEKVLNAPMQASLLKTLRQIRKLSLEDLLRFILREIREILSIERISIFRVNNELEEFQIIMGEPEGKHSIGQRFPFDSQKHLKKAVETKSWVEEIEPGLDPEMWRLKELVYIEGITDIAVSPIMIDNEVEWLMVIDAKWPRIHFTDEEKDFCLSMADLAGLLLERDQRQKEMDEKETLLIMGRVTAEAIDRLKTPVDVMRRFARKLAKVMIDVNCKISYRRFAFVREILYESAKLEKIVNALVRFSRNRKAEITDLNVNEIVLKIKQSFNEQLKRKNIRFNLNLDPELPTISADPTDIEEVFYPIMQNAVEAIQKEGEIKIKSKCQDCWIKVSVSNTGGCDKEILQEIFNPFFTTKPGAAGLGLATAITIIKAYGGEIEMQNDKTLNLTTFVIKFPLPVS